MDAFAQFKEKLAKPVDFNEVKPKLNYYYQKDGSPLVYTSLSFEVRSADGLPFHGEGILHSRVAGALSAKALDDWLPGLIARMPFKKIEGESIGRMQMVDLSSPFLAKIRREIDWLERVLYAGRCNHYVDFSDPDSRFELIMLVSMEFDSSRVMIEEVVDIEANELIDIPSETGLYFSLYAHKDGVETQIPNHYFEIQGSKHD